MNLIKTSLLAVVATLTISSVHATSSTTKSSPKKDSIDYFYANPKLAMETVKTCDLQIATNSDREKVYGPQGKCRNALLARKKIVRDRNSSSNPMPKFDFSNVNKPKS